MVALEFYIEVDRQSGDKGDERCDKPEYGRQTSHTLDINSRYVSLLDVAIDKRPSVRKCLGRMCTSISASGLSLYS